MLIYATEKERAICKARELMGYEVSSKCLKCGTLLTQRSGNERWA